MNITEVFESLCGEWQLIREYAPGGHFEGLGFFTAIASDKYAYHEIGTLTLDNDEVLEDVRKQYIYALEEGRIAVYFDDGPDKEKLFHILDFKTDTNATCEHQCIDDHYSSTYHFDLPKGFTVKHLIKGPNKDYCMETSYKRLEAEISLN